MITPTFVTHATSPLCNGLCLYPWLRSCNEEEIVCSSNRDWCLYFLRGARKEARIEIREVFSLHHSRVNFITLQELLAINTQSSTRDLNIICEHLKVIKNECQVWVELYRTSKSHKLINWIWIQWISRFKHEESKRNMGWYTTRTRSLLWKAINLTLYGPSTHICIKEIPCASILI